ncbi:hypothetical protein H0H92_007205 [Tricholoma furcatifolium]|nr:hypothetical protein H0H92_007205 [Tricholoma furcatifolium]
MNSPDYGGLGFKDIVVSLEGAVVVIVLNRSKQSVSDKPLFVKCSWIFRRNSINQNMIFELKEVFTLCDKDDRVRAIILTADPSAPAYCSGADISGGWDVLWNEESEKEGDHGLCSPFAIDGAGAGVTALQLPFDFRFVWRKACDFVKFNSVQALSILIATSTYLLPRLLGHSRATSLLLTGATVAPDSPVIHGLYQEILATRQDVFPTAKAFVTELVSNTSQPSVAYTKALIRHPGDSIEENHLLDSMAMRVLGKSRDSVEGVESFKERRTPRFTDRLSETEKVFPAWK